MPDPALRPARPLAAPAGAGDGDLRSLPLFADVLPDEALDAPASPDPAPRPNLLPALVQGAFVFAVLHQLVALLWGLG